MAVPHIYLFMYVVNISLQTVSIVISYLLTHIYTIGIICDHYENFFCVLMRPIFFTLIKSGFYVCVFFFGDYLVSP